MSIYSRNESGFNGVNWYKRDKKWRARLRVDGKEVHGGYFTNKDDAIAKRKEMNLEYGFHVNHGKLNQVNSQ